MGQFGKYQFCMTFLLSLFQVPNTFHIASSIYQVSNTRKHAGTPPHADMIPDFSLMYTSLVGR